MPQQSKVVFAGQPHHRFQLKPNIQNTIEPKRLFLPWDRIPILIKYSLKIIWLKKDLADQKEISYDANCLWNFKRHKKYPYYNVSI